MRRVRLERLLAAHRDGELSPDDRGRVAKLLERDPEVARLLVRGEALGRVVRDAWTEGPEAPAPETFLAGLPAELGRVDAELKRGHAAWTHSMRRVFAVSPTPALAGAAALVVAALLLFSPGNPLAPAGTAPAQAREATVYALEGEYSVFVFEPEGEDAATVIWVLEGEDDLSGLVADGGFG